VTYRGRLLLLTILGGLGGTVLLVRLFSMQVAGSGVSREAAERQGADWRPLHERRGRILDARGNELAAEEVGYELAVRTAAWRAVMHECPRCGLVRFYAAGQKARPCTRCKAPLAQVDRADVTPLARLLGISVAELVERVEERVKEAQASVERGLGDLPPRQAAQERKRLETDHGWRPRRIARDVSYEVAREVELNPHANPAFRIRAQHTRRATGGRDFVHLLGQVRQEQREVPGAEGLVVDAAVGASGVELALDGALSGEPGWIRILRDPRDGEAQVVERHPPRHGLDVRLTIAAADQALAVAALGGASGAFVVIDALDGGVLAAASAPGYEPGDYARVLGEITEEKERRGRWPKHHALRESALADFDVPGSIVKPMTAIAALLSGVATAETRISCDRFFRNRRGQPLQTLRCSHEHGELDLRDALVRSCNVYFQTVQKHAIEQGRFDSFFEVSRRFGFGLPTGVELEPDPFPDTYDPGRTWEQNVTMAIGQGRVRLSPAQVARAYAGLFTGALPTVHLVAEVGGRPVSPRRTPLGIDERALRFVRDALADVARTGTAAGFGLERWPAALKTGTAQLGGKLQNAWLAGYLPAHAGRPAFAFAMVVFDTELNGADACAPRLAEFLRGFYGEGRE